MLHWLGLVTAVSLLAGPALAWLRVVRPIVGFGLFALGGLGAVVIAVLSIVRAARGHGMSLGGWLAIATGAVFMTIASRGAGIPAINDFTTDPADPPAFVHAGSLPENAGRDLAYPPRFAEVQRACCADLRPARLSVGREEAFARVRGAAARMPAWRITSTDRDAGTIEAVATTALFHFQDDIVIRVRPEGGDASRVDMRSKSRDGKGDIGANAARIRAFVAALEAPTSGTP